MKVVQLLGWGIAIYAVMFLLWTGLIMYGFVNGIVPHILALLVLVATTAIAARSLNYTSWAEILPYSLTWGLMMVALDAVMSVPLYGWGLYADWNLWFGYGLVVVLPILAPKVWKWKG